MFKNLGKVGALNKLLEKDLKRNSLTVFSGTIKKVLILVNADDTNYRDVFKDLHLGLGVKSQDIHILSFREKIYKKEERPFNVITPKQFNRKGQIQGEFAHFNPSQEFDLIIAFYEQPQLFLNSIVQNQPSAFKVGLCDNYEELFHFILTTKTSQIDLFIAELLRYLRILKYIA